MTIEFIRSHDHKKTEYSEPRLMMYKKLHAIWHHGGNKQMQLNNLITNLTQSNQGIPAECESLVDKLCDYGILLKIPIKHVNGGFFILARFIK